MSPKENMDEFFDEHFGADKIKPAKKNDLAPTDKERAKMDQNLDDMNEVEWLDGLDLETVVAEGDDVESISNNYLYSIFGDKKDKYKTASYITQIHKAKIRQGYPEGTLLNSYLFLAAILRRYQVQYQQFHRAAVAKKVPFPEDDRTLKKIEELSDKLVKLQKGLDDQRNAMRSGSDIHDLHEKELTENAEFVKEHVGEFSFRCSKCDTIVLAGGLPHWAFKVDRGDQGDPIYHVWSAELQFLAHRGIIPLHVVAFALQTSIEGIQYTADMRGEKLPKHQIIEEEDKLKELLIGFEKSIPKRKKEV